MIRQGLGAGEKFRNSIINSGQIFDPSGGMITIGLDSTHYTTQETGSIAIGYNAVKGLNDTNAYSQKQGSIAIGLDVADTGQDTNAIAIGNNSGGIKIQGESSIAIGNLAGQEGQGTYAIAIGDSAGRNQGVNSIAIGNSAGQSVGENAVVIGYNAGVSSSGTNSIMIGSNSNCHYNNSPISNSIVLNASNSLLTASTDNAFHVSPIRKKKQRTVLGYDINTAEITYYVPPSSNLIYQEIPHFYEGILLIAASAKTSNTIPPEQVYTYDLIEYSSEGAFADYRATTKKIDGHSILEKSARNVVYTDISLTPTDLQNQFYNIAITGGPDVTEETTSLPPSIIDIYVKIISANDAFIIKLTWCASGEYILQKYKEINSYIGLDGQGCQFGIPLLNPSNVSDILMVNPCTSIVHS